MTVLNGHVAPEPPLIVAREVQGALDTGAPVVALESTVISHGLPRRLNLETALALEDQVRQAGAVPATVGVLAGAIRVGLSADDLATMAAEPEVLKVSSRGLSYAVATGRTAATTVSGTMWAAHKAGIDFFATGGIGGVHRGASSTGDVSTDLTELSRVPVVVVCSGAKSVLDISMTLEFLETLGVPVFGYGTDDFPAFYTRSSGHPAPYTVSDSAQMARVVRAHRALGMSSGMLIACPPPVEPADEQMFERAIEQALAAAAEQSIRGLDLTPFLPQRVAELTGGASTRVNVELLRNNAYTAGLIAKEYADLS